MASVHAINHKQTVPAFFTTHLGAPLPQVNNASDMANSQRKWTYLMAENVSCVDAKPNMLQIRKPEQNLVFPWLLKIVMAGQCETLIVEDLPFDDVMLAKLKSACSLNNVTLINLKTTISNNSKRSNILRGPW